MRQSLAVGTVARGPLSSSPMHTLSRSLLKEPWSARAAVRLLLICRSGWPVLPLYLARTRRGSVRSCYVIP